LFIFQLPAMISLRSLSMCVSKTELTGFTGFLFELCVLHPNSVNPVNPV